MKEEEEEIITKNINSASGNGNGLKHAAITNTNEGLWWEILLMLRIMKKNLMLTIFIFLTSSTAAFWNFEICSSYSATARFSVSDWKKWYPTNR